MATSRHAASGGDRPSEADGARPARGHVMHHRVLGCTPQLVSVTIHFPEDLWRAVQALATEEGDTNTVILRALEEYVTTAATR